MIYEWIYLNDKYKFKVLITFIYISHYHNIVEVISTTRLYGYMVMRIARQLGHIHVTSSRYDRFR